MPTSGRSEEFLTWSIDVDDVRANLLPARAYGADGEASLTDNPLPETVRRIGAGNEGAAVDLQITAATEIPELSSAELVHLRIRAIALENLVIVLLAQNSDQPLVVPREMASYITPRPGFPQHLLTIHAA